MRSAESEERAILSASGHRRMLYLRGQDFLRGQEGWPGVELEPKPSPESQGDKESLHRVTVRLSITVSDPTTAKTANPGR